MMKLLIPLILMLIGTGGGVAAGFFLRSEPEPEAPAMADGNPCGDLAADAAAEDEIDAELPAPEDVEYAKLNNQFIVPIVTEGRINSMVVISLSIEVPTGQKEPIFAAEPRLRDAFLQVFFNHANIGGFSGNYTSSTNMRMLREELLRAARRIAGPVANDVLILDIVRQDT